MLQPLRQVYDSRHPHFVLYARSQVEEAVGPELASKGGLKIYTTLDPDLQTAAEESVQKQVAQLSNQGAHNGAVVALRPQTGEVLAMVGSADFNSTEISGQINMAIQPRAARLGAETVRLPVLIRDARLSCDRRQQRGGRAPVADRQPVDHAGPRR